MKRRYYQVLVDSLHARSVPVKIFSDRPSAAQFVKEQNAKARRNHSEARYRVRAQTTE